MLSTSRRLHTYLFFAEVYDACRYKWTLGRALTEWYADMKPAFRRCMSFIKEVVTSNWFEYTICKSAFHLIKTSDNENAVKLLEFQLYLEREQVVH